MSRRKLLGVLAAAGMEALIGLDYMGTDEAFAADADMGWPALNPEVLNEHASLNVWLVPELANHPAYRHAITMFKQKYQFVSVNVTPVAKDDIPTRLKIAVLSGGNSVVPDLISHHGYVFGAQGLAQECDFLWAAWGAVDTFIPTALDDVTWRLNKFGIPLYGNAVVTIINQQLFDRAGVRIPDGSNTFSQFVSAVTAVKRATGTPYGTLLSADPATVTALIHANGGALLETELISGRNLQLLTDSRVIDAIRFYTELGWKDHLAPVPSTSTTNSLYLAELFAARRAPAFFGTLSDLALITSVDPTLKISISPLPGGTTGRTSGSVNDGASLVVIADPLFPQRHPHAAFELGKWLVASQPALAVAQTLRYAPTVSAYYNNALFRQDAATRTYFQVARTARPVLLDAYSTAFDYYLGALRACFGGADPAQQLRSVAGPVQTAMDRADAGLDSDG